MEYLLKCYHDSRIFALTIRKSIPRQERRTYNWNKVVNLGCAPTAIEEGTFGEIIFLANKKVIKINQTVFGSRFIKRIKH